MSFSIWVFDAWVDSNPNSNTRMAFLVGLLGFVMFLPRYVVLVGFAFKFCYAICFAICMQKR
jgi:hypothetical protein